MTDDEINEIEARANAATPGPWTIENHAIYGWWTHEGREPFPVVVFHLETAEDLDAEFAAHAREDIPKLIAEVKRLRKMNERLIKRTAETTSTIDRLLKEARALK